MIAPLFHTVAVGREQEDIRHDPGRRACKAHRGEADPGHKAQSDYAPGNHLEHARHHGKLGIAKPLNGEAQQVHKQQEYKEDDLDQQELTAQVTDVRYRCRVLGVQKQQAQRTAPEIHGKKNQITGG